MTFKHWKDGASKWATLKTRKVLKPTLDPAATRKHYAVGFSGGYNVFTDLKGDKSQQTTFLEEVGKGEEEGGLQGPVLISQSLCSLRYPQDPTRSSTTS